MTPPDRWDRFLWFDDGMPAEPSRTISLLSVVIPTFNAVDLIGEQLAALDAQKYNGAFEVIVSDNGSTDGLRSYIESHPLGEVLRLRWVDSSSARGVSHARNVGVEHAAGEFVAFCDADDRVHPEWLQHMATAAQTADVVGGGLETASINTPLVNSWREFVPSETPHSYGSFLPYAFGANFGAWKIQYQSIGGCDESMTAAGDDIDFCWRAQMAGMTFAHEPKAVVAYRLRSEIASAWKQMRMYGSASAMLHKKYKRHGFKKPSGRALLTEIAALTLLNPVLPHSVTKMPRGKWVTHAGFFVGKVQGSIRERTLFV